MESPVQKQLRILLEQKCSDIFNELLLILKQDFTLICYSDANVAFKTTSQSANEFVDCLTLAVNSYKETGSFVNTHVPQNLKELKQAQDILPKSDDCLYSLIIGNSKKCIGYMASVNREDAALMFSKLASSVAENHCGVSRVEAIEDLVKYFTKKKEEELS